MKSKWNKFHLTLKIGLILFLAGSGPLLIIIGFHELGIIEADNAILPGILTMLTFWPSVVLILIGSIITLFKLNREKTK
jgi:Na+/melibiose symporter-like transporter